MTSVKHKIFFDYEKEERWLNEMSAKGFALCNYCFGKYTFTECEPSEYTYRIELLENPPKHEESAKYIGFLEENGIERVAVYSNWVYLRRKTSDGTFTVYSDINSRIKHYSGIAALYTCVSCALLPAFLNNFAMGLSTLKKPDSFLHEYSAIPLVTSGLSLIMLIFMLAGCVRQWKKVHKLQLEKSIRE